MINIKTAAFQSRVLCLKINQYWKWVGLFLQVKLLMSTQISNDYSYCSVESSLSLPPTRLLLPISSPLGLGLFLLLLGKLTSILLLLGLLWGLASSLSILLLLAVGLRRHCGQISSCVASRRAESWLICLVDWPDYKGDFQDYFDYLNESESMKITVALTAIKV